LPNGHELKAGDPVVTYVARNLEPYRGFHRLVRSLPAILATHPACQVLVIGGDKTSYGRPPTNAANWREALLGAAAQQHPAQPALDTSRVHFLGVLPTDSYRKALQISAAHLYLTYPFVLSWSLIEAMASACLLIASDTAPVRELIEHQRNGLLVDFFSEEQLVQAVSSALNQPAQFQTLRQTAMADARQGYSREAGTRAYVRWILGDKPSHPRNGPIEVS
jgi:glycosyltransferase involved in cell wall biosynthesis